MSIPKGIILIVGGSEKIKAHGEESVKFSEFRPYEILKELLSRKRSRQNIEIITTATTVPTKAGKLYKGAFKKLGFHVGSIHIEDREHANSEEVVQRIRDAHVVFFSGGDQLRLPAILASTVVMDQIWEKYMHERDFILAGTSAGAMAMSKIMIYRGLSGEAMMMGDVNISSGFGFLDGCIIDTHFIQRKRINRLIQAIITNPSYIGIGLCEDTALVIRKGDKMECYGSGMVMVIDAHSIKKTNAPYAADGTPLWVENIIIHILVKGTGFYLKEKKFFINQDGTGY